MELQLLIIGCSVDIHATNVAVQKTAPDYNCEKGCKWLLRNFRIFLGAKHGQAIADAVFTEMEAIVVRSLMSVQKVIIADRHCFELYATHAATHANSNA